MLPPWQQSACSIPTGTQGWAASPARLHCGYSWGATGLNYASEYRDVEVIIVPTRRRIYAYEKDYQPVIERLLVKIDLGEITLT
jgi:hypothetical protein